MDNKTVVGPNTPEEAAAIQSGAMAGLEGTSTDKNPYDESSPLHKLWLAAWLRPRMYIGEDIVPTKEPF